MDFELSKELRELQAAARHFVERELVPHELYVDEHESIPADVLERIRAKAIEYGLWPMNVPRELGGLGSSVLAQVVAQEQAGRATNGLWAHVGGPYNALLRCAASGRSPTRCRSPAEARTPRTSRPPRRSEATAG